MGTTRETDGREVGETWCLWQLGGTIGVPIISAELKLTPATCHRPSHDSINLLAWTPGMYLCLQLLTIRTQAGAPR
jgi:hypothetical protein